MVGELQHHGALFGRNPFGETIVKNMYYTKRSLCNGQIPDTPDYIKQDGYFLLVDRGECSFVEKVRNAQRDGATAVFIADDRCLCSVDDSCAPDADDVCEVIEPSMDDDGTGSDIDIPSMLLLKSDADRLRNEIISGTMIETSISFPVSKAVNGRTEYMLFTTPDDLSSHQFLNSFLEAALSFGERAVFKPRMLLTDGSEKGCRQYDESSQVPCKGYCTNYGRYCESRSFYDQEHYEDKGTKMIVESMRRACIWNIYGKVDGVGHQWWAYVQLWMLQCSFSHYSTSCAESIYSVSGVDKEELETCMENSGNFREDVLNTLTETSLFDATKYQVQFAPALVVNGAIINGALNFGNAMNAICSTFEDSDKPEICGKWDICADASGNKSDFILWGDNQECAEYRAPFLSNDGKEFDDDYLNFDIDDKTTISPELKNVDTIPSTETATESSIITDEDSNTKDDPTNPVVDAVLEVDTDTKRPVDLNNSIYEEEIPNPPLLSDPLYISPTNGSLFLNTADTNNVKDNERMYSHDGQQEFLETIQIYEGSNSDLAIGLGIGFGSAFLLMVIYLLLSRDRERQRMEDLITSGRIPATRLRSGLSTSSQRYYAHYSNHSRTPKEIPDEFSDENDQFNDEGEVEDCYDSHYRHTTRSRERDQLFPRNSKRKSMTRRRFLEHLPHDNVSVSNEQEEIKEIPYANERASSIRKQINDDEFDDDYDVDNDRNRRKFDGECDDDNDDDYDDVDRYMSESHR